MAEAVTTFTCTSCKRAFTWKPELAGKRVKCKCGQPIDVPKPVAAPIPVSTPAPVESTPDDDDIYGLADGAGDNPKPVKKLPSLLAPATPEGPTLAAVAAGGAKPGVPLEYQRGQTARQRETAGAHVDINRDLYVPLAMLIAGAILYISYYGIHYSLGPTGLLATSIGLVIMTALETALLFGFALFIAGPLGVSFGSVSSAILKFAALALFCDGATTWVDGLISKFAGGMGGGVFGFGAIGFPVAIGIYWASLIYLFTMDPGDSWMVVIILSIFYRILRIVLILLLLKLILSFGGVSGASSPIPIAGGGSAGDSASTSSQEEVDSAMSHHSLHEARQYAHDFGRRAESPTVEALYTAGCEMVWFETTRDINGKGTAYRIVAQLPSDKTGRAKCYQAGKDYYNAYHSGDPNEVQDDGDKYLFIQLPE